MDKEFDQLRQTLGQNVRSLCLGLGLSQEQLAFDAEIDRTYVSQIERAVINPHSKFSTGSARSWG